MAENLKVDYFQRVAPTLREFMFWRQLMVLFDISYN